VLEIEEVDGRSRSHASRGRRSGSSQGGSRRGPLAGRLRGNRADAAHGRISRRNGVQGVVVIHPRIHGALARVAQAARVVDTVEGVLGRGCVTPLRGWRKSDLGHAGRLRRRRGNATKSGPRTAMSAGGPPGSWRIHAGSGRRAKATRCDELSPDGAGWGCLQTTRERQRSALKESVKAPPGVTSRGGSACKWLATVERRVSYGSSGSREHGFGRWSRSRGRPRRDRACTGRRRIEAGGR
jgi:hypothetical protein